MPVTCYNIKIHENYLINFMFCYNMMQHITRYILHVLFTCKVLKHKKFSTFYCNISQHLTFRSFQINAGKFQKEEAKLREF